MAAKAEIYRLMEDIVHSGKSIIVVSSELPEVMGISDRMVIMCEGKKRQVNCRKKRFAEQVILNYAMGGKTMGKGNNNRQRHGRTWILAALSAK